MQSSGGSSPQRSRQRNGTHNSFRARGRRGRRTQRGTGGRLRKDHYFDMGGTSTDVALCERDGLRMTNEALVAGLPVAVSVMDIHTVGAGGGSIAES